MVKKAESAIPERADDARRFNGAKMPYDEEFDNELSKCRPDLRTWLDEMRCTARLPGDLTILLGLSREETLEFLNLDPIVMHDGPRDHKARERYYSLREKHDGARAADALQNIGRANSVKN